MTAVLTIIGCLILLVSGLEFSSSLVFVPMTVFNITRIGHLAPANR